MSLLGSRRRISKARNIGNKNDIVNYYVFDDIENTTKFTWTPFGGTLENRETGEKINHMRPSVFAEKAKDEILKLRFQIQLLKEGRNPDMDKSEDIFTDCGNYFLIQHYNLNELNIDKTMSECIISENGMEHELFLGIDNKKPVVMINYLKYTSGLDRNRCKIVLEKEESIFTYKVPEPHYELVKDILTEVKKARMARELMK